MQNHAPYGSPRRVERECRHLFARGGARHLLRSLHVQNTQPNPQAADAGEADWSADLVYVDLPVTSSADVHDGDLVTITSCVNDPGAVDLQVHVVGGHWQTYSKERRLPCRLVTRDA